MAAIGLQCSCGRPVPESVISLLVASPENAGIKCSSCGKVSGLEHLVPVRVATTPGTGRCPTCGYEAKKLNPHRMDAGKVRVLRAIAKLNDDGYEWVKVTQGSDLIVGEDRVYKTIYRVSEYASRLKWFGLLDYNGRRTGQYKINDAGRRFLAGTTTVPDTIWCRDGEVIERAEKHVTVDEANQVTLDEEYWDGYADETRHAEGGPAVTKV